MIRPTAVVALFVIALAAGGPRAALAQQPGTPPPTIAGVEITMNRPEASIGDRVLLTLRVRHRADVAVTAVPEPPRDVEFGKPAVTTFAMPDGVIQTTIVWTVQPFILGPVVLRPFPVSWVTQDGRTGRFLVQPPRFEVKPLRAPEDVGLRPLKDPVAVPGGPPAWLRPTLMALAVAAVLAVAGGAGFLLWRRLERYLLRRRPALTPDAALAPVSAESSARDSLNAVAGLALTDAAAFERYYGTIALVVRRYLTERIGFNADALTTEELERRMTANGVDRWQARLVGGLLERCDAAVYAHRFPDPASADHDLTVAFEIVELSRPGAQRTGVVPQGASA